MCVGFLPVHIERLIWPTPRPWISEDTPEWRLGKGPLLDFGPCPMVSGRRFLPILLLPP